MTPDHAARKSTPTALVDLPDGRRIEVRVSGPEVGVPLVFHHGTPGSSLPLRVVERSVHERDLRLVTMSRPGYGGSTRLAGRSAADVVADTDAVLDWLGEDRCFVAGWSGGGPHALACAARLGRAAGALVIASPAPYEAQDLDWMAGMGEDNLAEFDAALGGEASLRALLDPMRIHMVAMGPSEIATAMASLLPRADREALTGEVAEDLAASIRDAMRVGVDGWVDDDLAAIGDWGFTLDECTVPISLWQGTEDLMVPFTHGTWLTSHLPGASAHHLDGEGHVSIVAGSIGDMLDELIALSR